MDVLHALLALAAMTFTVAHIRTFPGLADNRERDATKGMGYLLGNMILVYLARDPGVYRPDHRVIAVAGAVVALAIAASTLAMLARVIVLRKLLVPGLKAIGRLGREFWTTVKPNGPRHPVRPGLCGCRSNSGRSCRLKSERLLSY